MAYESITVYAGQLEKDPGTMSKVVTDGNKVVNPPHYIPSEAMAGFEWAFYNNEICDRNYVESLRRAGIDLGSTDASTLDVDSMDAPLVLAILTLCIRSERFCEGSLLSAAKSGLLDRCLYRLAEIDEYESAYAELPERTKAVASALVDVLDTLDDGLELTTGELATSLSLEKPDFVDDEVAEALREIMISSNGMFDLDFAIRHEARSRSIVLDSSAYEDMVVGLPFNIPYTVRKER